MNADWNIEVEVPRCSRRRCVSAHRQLPRLLHRSSHRRCRRRWCRCPDAACNRLVTVGERRKQSESVEFTAQCLAHRYDLVAAGYVELVLDFGESSVQATARCSRISPESPVWTIREQSLTAGAVVTNAELNGSDVVAASHDDQRCNDHSAPHRSNDRTPAGPTNDMESTTQRSRLRDPLALTVRNRPAVAPDALTSGAFGCERQVRWLAGL